MILVDSSVWIDHLRESNVRLASLLAADQVQTHAHVVGELALGSIRNRTEFLDALARLPFTVQASDGEVLSLVEQKKLFARGIGYTDAHLVTSTLLTPGTWLWTLDRRLGDVAGELGIAATLP
ncbi:MAG: hypothetical protein Q8S09_02905 [Hyphomonas sp.]|nr:hypothetical protein [Hyphomonas sp.]